MKAESLELLLYWVRERHSIYLKKSSGQAFPWTEDEILKTKRFCNVFRELDKETLWIRENWLNPLKDDENLWFAPFIFRMFNLGSTFEKFFVSTKGRNIVTNFEENRDLFDKYLRELSKTTPVFSSAYMLTTHGKATDSKSSFYLNELIPILHGKKQEILEILKSNSFEESFSKIKDLNLPAYKGFILYQALLDLTYTKYLTDHTDKYSWTLIGPGAVRGLNRLYGRGVGDSLSQTKALDECRKLMDVVNKDIDKTLFIDTFNKLGYKEPLFDIHTVEFWLCEFDKYCRCQLGQGVLKNYKLTTK